MLTTLIIVLLGLALFAYVALPLIFPQGADPLPSQRDPVTADLEEEKEALFRAIRELDARDDLSEERRDNLRARYEAKAAKVLRLLDERSTAGGAPAKPAAGRKWGVPYGALALLGLTGVVALLLGTWVLPRVGEGTVTTFFERDLESAQQLREVERAAERDPSAQNLLALGDAYWQLNDPEAARETYGRAVAAGAQSALAYRRLGFLTLQEDLDAALAYLERAREFDPEDLDTLYTIGEIRFAQGDMAGARDAWRAFLDAPGGGDDPQVLARLELIREVEPVAARVAEDPSQENLLELADVFWRYDERSRAVEIYFQVLTQHDPNDATALGRTGQLMFLSGRNEDAIMLMERAAASEAVDRQTLLFLGNAYFSAERYQEAIEVWERHLDQVPEAEAGRVPQLIEDARAQLAGTAEEPPDLTPVMPEDGVSADASTTPGEGESAGVAAAPGGVDSAGNGDLGASVFAANCATCHGPQGGGGVGPQLAGNRRAANESNVRNAVQFGRGMMPGFQATLNADELEAVVQFVVDELSGAD